MTAAWVETDSPRLSLVQRLDNGAAKSKRINAAGFAIDDFAFRIDQHGQWHIALPLWVEGVDQGCAVGGAENQVFVRGLVLLQELQHLLFFVRLIERNEHDLEIAMAIHAVDGDEFIELSHARGAPCRPEIYQTELA